MSIQIITTIITKPIKISTEFTILTITKPYMALCKPKPVSRLAKITLAPMSNTRKHMISLKKCKLALGWSRI